MTKRIIEGMDQFDVEQDVFVVSVRLAFEVTFFGYVEHVNRSWLE